MAYLGTRKVVDTYCIRVIGVAGLAKQINRFLNMNYASVMLNTHSFDIEPSIQYIVAITIILVYFNFCAI